MMKDANGVLGALVCWLIVGVMAFSISGGMFGRHSFHYTLRERGERKSEFQILDEELYLQEYWIRRKIADGAEISELNFRDPYSDENLIIFQTPSGVVWARSAGRDKDWDEGFLPYDPTNGSVSSGDYYHKVYH